MKTPEQWINETNAYLDEYETNDLLKQFADIKADAMAEQRRLDAAICDSFKDKLDAATCNSIKATILTPHIT